MKIWTAVLMMGLATAAWAQQPAAKQAAAKPAAVSAKAQDPGARAFKANCSRCHSAPEQITPRIAGTVLMHMRVKASLSEADEKAILHYLAP